MEPLAHESLLSTLAEMSIAVVGFAMVGGILRPRSRDDAERLFTLRDVAAIGLITAVMSAFPMVIYAHGVSAEWTWRLGSGVQLAWSFAGIAFANRRRGAELPAMIRRYRLTAVLVYGLVVVNLGMALMNLVVPSGARFAACMLLGLAQAGFMFIFAVFDLGQDEPTASK